MNENVQFLPMAALGSVVQECLQWYDFAWQTTVRQL